VFIDSAELYVKAGDGGSGCIAFRREKFVPKGGPSGGDGGRGGHIILRADRHLTTLLDFKYRKKYVAGRGQHGSGDNRTGRNGRDVVIRVPAGTVVLDHESGNVLEDLVEDAQEVVVARGGRGGRGNARFASASNQAPREFEPGFDGEERNLRLELKLLADVGLVGLPNAGKSTLLSRISAARPKVAEYPFTTLIPNLGLVRVGDTGSFVAADIPGLVEGAHDGKGLGLTFLKHIERTRVLVILLDATSSALENDYATLLDEMNLYDPWLLRRPRIIAYNKCDIIEKEFSGLERTITGQLQTFLISAVRGDGIEEMVNALWNMLNELDV